MSEKSLKLNEILTSSSRATTQVFISHANQDSDIASRIFHDLEAAGIDAWVDVHCIKPSDDYSAEIHNALATSTHVVVLLSKASIESEYVRAEWEYALGNKKHVFILLCEAVEKAHIPPRLWTIQRVDIHEDYDINIPHLIAAIREQSPGSTTADMDSLDIERSLKPSQLVDGDIVEITLDIRNCYAKTIRNIRVVDILPSNTTLSDGTNTWDGDLQSNESMRLNYKLEISGSGHLEFPGVRFSYDIDNLTVTDQSGRNSFPVEECTPPELDVSIEVFPSIGIIGQPLDVYYQVLNRGTTKADGIGIEIIFEECPFALSKPTEVSQAGISIERKSSWTKQISLSSLRYGRHKLPRLNGKYGDQVFASPETTCLIELPWDSSFVGREQTFNILLNLLKKIQSGRGQVALVYGEAGAGKSYVIEKYLTRATQDGVLCLSGQCQAFHDTVSFLPFKQMFEYLLTLPRFGTKEERLEEATKQLRDVLPEIEAKIPLLTSFLVAEHDDIEITDPKERREAFLFAAYEMIELLSKSRPIIIYIEDLQWSDTSTLDLMQYLANNIQQLPVMLLGEYRLEEVETKRGEEQRLHPLVDWIRHNASTQHFQQFEVNRFDRDNLSSWINSVFQNNNFPDAFLTLLYQETEGNPLFAREALKSLIEQNIIQQNDANTWYIHQHVGSINLPSTIEQVIASRLDRLDDAEVKELEHAAIIGRDFAYELLQAISAHEENVLFDYLENYLDIRLIIELEEKDDYFRFTHGKIREYIYQAIRRFRRRQLHLRLANVMELLYANNIQSVSAIVAHHFEEGGNAEKAAEYYISAGNSNLNQYASREAQQNFRKATDLLENIAEGNRDQRLYLSSLFGLARATRELNDFDRALGLFKNVLSISEKLQDDETSFEATSRISKLSSIQGDFETAISYSEKALKIADRLNLPDISITVANDLSDILRRYHRSALMKEDDSVERIYDEFKKYVYHALSLVDTTADTHQIVRAYKNVGRFHDLNMDYQKAVEMYEKGLQVAEQKNDITSKYVYVLLASSYKALNETDKAIDAYQKYHDWAVEVEANHAIMKAHQVLGLQYIEKNEFDRAMSHLEKGAAMFESIGDKNLLSLIQVCIGYIGEHRGKSEEANAAYRKALELQGVNTDVESQSFIYNKLGQFLISSREASLAKHFYELYLEVTLDANDQAEIEAILSSLN